MKKIFAVFPIAILFILLSKNYKAFASTYSLNPDNYQNVVYITGYNSAWYSGQQLVTIVAGSNYVLSFNNGTTPDNLRSSFNVFNLINVNIGDFTIESNVGTQSNSFNMTNIQQIVVYKGSFNFGNYTTPEQSFDNWQDYQDYINPPDPPPELTWYESLFNDFIDYLGAGLSNGIDGFINWLKEAWTVPVGEGEDELAIDLITPPPPTPTPTPIPYQTVLQPDNNGGYQIQYIYPDPSGNPTAAPQPPNNTNITNNYGSDFEYPYYENNTNKNDPYVLDIPWYLRFIFKGQTTSLSDFQNGVDATIETVNNSEEQINTVMDSMSIFPSEWLLMIGFIGAIPLVGGIISRLLKG